MGNPIEGKLLASGLQTGVHMNKGKIVKVVGPVVDVEFPGRAARDLQRSDLRVQN